MPRHLGLLIAVVVLGGCAASPAKVTVPQVVQVPVVTYAPVPAELTAACPIETPQNRTIAEVVRVANARKQALIACNRQLDAIRALGKSKP